MKHAISDDQIPKIPFSPREVREILTRITQSIEEAIDRGDIIYMGSNHHGSHVHHIIYSGKNG